jgi:hypothetical protein
MDAGGVQLERRALLWLPSDEARSITARELGIAVAPFERCPGVVVGNIFEPYTQEWLDSSPRSPPICVLYLVSQGTLNLCT